MKKEKMDNMFFQDNNQRFYVKLEKSVYEKILHYCLISYPKETGGILIGNYSQNLSTANIMQTSEPPQKSIHKRNFFKRSSNGLKSIFDDAWKNGQYYLGEWHYHPDASAKPSSLDINQMIAFSKDENLKCPEPILMIIGGVGISREIFISVFTENSYIVLNHIEVDYIDN
ncbi:Mov34/MPN/PAD-1 family protein [Acetobacterium sp. K1/6]|uniref:Mov34/MPN/PAD-1 family protein n=1 Tax=Acetobacterium sp. K1/6 TaxID=3055467 RepID=UPI002ACB022D|nr:Mov34/MPN/PAD-1 family protein [Acetobacterium sp. K1/6]MDZ5726801.1 Mov34/MPN/PAD-1 family protein [Acetobacterium sp. K1/6]